MLDDVRRYGTGRPVRNCLVRAGDSVGTIVRLAPAVDPQEAEMRLHDGSTTWARLDELRSAFGPGLEVDHAPGTRQSFGSGRVEAIRTLAGRDQCLVLFFRDGISRWLPYETLAYCADVAYRLRAGALGRYQDHAERFRLRTLGLALSAWSASTGAFGRLDVDPLPHQIHVARRVVDAGAPGWLIADDVGLGKTIEMGLILHALRRQGRARRTLIVCPSSLVRQWKLEMRVRFNQTFVIYGRDIAPEHPEELALHDGVIISMDLAKRPEHARLLLESGGWDLVAVDEAHRLGISEDGERTERYRLAEELRAVTPMMILLTATPHQGKSRRFAALLELARPDLEREIAALDVMPEVVGEIVIRNAKTRVTDAAGNLLFRGHDTERVQAEPTLEARRFDAALQSYLRHGYRAAESVEGRMGRAIGLVMTTYRKLASSSLAAIERALMLRRERLAAGDGLEDIARFEADLEAGRIAEDELAELPDRFTGRPFFANEAQEIDELLRLAAEARPTDAKRRLFTEQILDPLIEADQSLLVFTEYRATQDWIAEVASARLGDRSIALINGSMNVDQRTEQVERFNTGEARVMISTEAGGEGLNLHHRCHVMVNYDLPWNPSRLVQRIGRLYRYGQTRRVQVLNLSVDDGFDARALNLMLQRVQTIATDLASVQPGNAESLAADILGELLAQVDMEELLSRAEELRIERTDEEIEEALRFARRARAAEAEILAFADAAGSGTTTALDHRHLVAFTEGAARREGIEVRRADLDLGRVDAVLPPELVGRFSEYGRAEQVTLMAPRPGGSRPRQAHPLDLDAPLVKYLLDRVEARQFDGLFAASPDIDADALAVLRLRCQDSEARPMAERVAIGRRDGSGAWTELSAEAAADFLLRPLRSTDTRPSAQAEVDNLNAWAEHLLKREVEERRHPLFWRIEAAAAG